MLTENGVYMLARERSQAPHEPMLQVRQLSELRKGVIRVLFSDGKHQIQTLLNSDITDLYYYNTLSEYSIVRLHDWTLKLVNGHSAKLVIINQLDVVNVHPSLIGESPITIEAKENIEIPKVAGNAPNPPVYRPPAYANPRKQNVPVARIDRLNLSSKDWTIIARVTKKGPIKEWTNAKGSGKLFSINLIDSSGTEIQGTFFKEGVDKFYDEIQQGSVYSFSKGQIKSSQPKFTNICNDFCINFDTKAEIEPMADDGSISLPEFKPQKIQTLKHCESNKIVDILGIVNTVSEIVTIVSKKTGKTLRKQSLSIVDDTNHSVHLTVWEDQIEEIRSNIGEVLGLKSARVTHYNGISLTFDRGGTSVVRNVDPRLVQPLRQWYNANRSTVPVLLTVTQQEPSYQLSTIQSIHEEWKQKRAGEGTARIIGTITFIKKEEFESMAYTACKSPSCNKKVNLMTSGLYYCEHCQQAFEECDYKYMLNMKIEDSNDKLWATAFDKTGEHIMGVAAAELKHMMNRGDSIDSLGQYIMSKEHEFILKLRVQGTSMGPRLRITVASVKDVDGNVLSDYLNTMSGL